MVAAKPTPIATRPNRRTVLGWRSVAIDRTPEKSLDVLWILTAGIQRTLQQQARLVDVTPLEQHLSEMSRGMRDSPVRWPPPE